MTQRAAIYLRISDPKGDRADKFGLAVQEQACRQYAQRAGLTVAQIFTDAITGTTETRAGFGKLLAEADAYTDVVVYAVDRLARHPKAGYALLETLQASGLIVHTAIEGMLDLEDDAGALNFGIRVVMADAERRRVVRRMLEGKRQKVKAGKPLRPLFAYGYKDGQVYEPEAQWVRWIFEQALMVGTHELRDGLAELGVTTRKGSGWDRETLRKLLRNSIYRGEYLFGRDRVTRRALPDAVTAPCPRIVSDELWYAAQRAIDYRSRGAGRRGSRTDIFPLTGRIRCAKCGAAMVGAHSTTPASGKRNYYYNCGDRNLSPHNKKGCTHRKFYKHSEVHEAVWDALKALANQIDSLGAALVCPVPQKLDTTRAVMELDSQLQKAKNAYLRGIDTEDEYAETKATLTAQRAKLVALATAGESAPAPDIEHAQNVLLKALESADLHNVACQIGLRVEVAAGGNLSLTLDPP